MDTGLFDTLRGFKITSRKHRIADDDFIDRFNHYHTAILICILSIIICAKQYVVGEPLQCWVPKEFSGGWEAYAENFCWVKNTYYVPTGSSDLPKKGLRENDEIKYYQWVPFVLGLQALMFNVPRIFWQMLNWHSGIHLKSLMEKANDPANIDPTNRQDTLKSLSRHITNSLFYSKNKAPGIAVFVKRMIFRILCCGSSHSGTYLITLYLFSKILYVANLIGQFVILNAFLGTKYHFFGYELLKQLANGKSWEDTGHFPRVTYCDFKVRDLGQVRPYTLQCVLVINLFNEKVYIFLWFWFALALFVTAINLLKWMGWCMLAFRRQRAIRKVIRNENAEREMMDDFMNDLKADGMFVLKMVSINSGEILAHDLIRQLFAQYCEDRSVPPSFPTSPAPSSSVHPSGPPDPNDWSPPPKKRAADI